MANQKNTSFVFLKRFFQRFLCIHVKMIGRLIQDQQIRVPVDQLTKSYLCLFTTTQYPYLALNMLGSESAFCKGGTHFILGK